MGVLRSLAYEYLVPFTATNGQCGGFTVTDIVPKLRKKRRVLYVGDHELRGPADQIEANTRRYIEKHANRVFSDRDWTKIALTENQLNASPRLQRLAITKLDKRYKPARSTRPSSARHSGRAYYASSASTSTTCCRSRSTMCGSARSGSRRRCVLHSLGSHGGGHEPRRAPPLAAERAALCSCVRRRDRDLHRASAGPGKSVMAALCGEPTGVALAKAISIWTDAAMKPGARTLCLNCDTAFRPDVSPAAYASRCRSPIATRDRHRRLRELRSVKTCSRWRCSDCVRSGPTPTAMGGGHG